MHWQQSAKLQSLSTAKMFYLYLCLEADFKVLGGLNHVSTGQCMYVFRKLELNIRKDVRWENGMNGIWLHLHAEIFYNSNIYKE